MARGLAHALGLDLRGAIRSDAGQRIALDQWMVIGYAVDRGRRDVDDRPRAGGGEHGARAVDVDRVDLRGRIERQRGRRVNDHLAAGDRAVDVSAQTDVTAGSVICARSG